MPEWYQSPLIFLFPDQERLALPTHGMGQSVKSMGDLQKAPPGGTAAVNIATMGTRLDMDLPFELRALEICLDEVWVGIGSGLKHTPSRESISLI